MNSELKINRFWTNDIDEADDEFIRRRIGKGNPHLGSVTKLPYTLEIVRDLLQNPIGVSPTLFNEWDRNYFRNLRRRSLRVVFDNLPVERNVYHGRGKNYFQGPEDTCLAYCVVNGLSMLRSSVPEEIFLGLMNDSLNGEGVDFGDVMYYMDEFRPEGIRYKYDPTQQFNMRFGLYGNTFNKKSHFGNEQIKRNGQIIYESVGPNSLIITAVDFGAYFGDPSGPPGMHAVCLIGTAITPRKNMDVQVFDPRRGRAWIPIEHLTDVFVDERLLVLEKVS